MELGYVKPAHLPKNTQWECTKYPYMTSKNVSGLKKLAKALVLSSTAAPLQLCSHVPHTQQFIQRFMHCVHCAVIYHVGIIHTTQGLPTLSAGQLSNNYTKIQLEKTEYY